MTSIAAVIVMVIVTAVAATAAASSSSFGISVAENGGGLGTAADKY